MDYFTSDLHIGHDKPFIWESRGFSSIEEHNEEILNRWNSVVSPDDNVYILGDLCMAGNKTEWDKIYLNLNGKKFLIHGNHDTVNKIKVYTKEYGIVDCGLAYLYKYTKTKIFYLSHYPTMMSNGEDRRFIWNLSGHTHSKNKFEFGKYFVYNVNMDAHNCTPISIEDIVKDIYNYKKENS